MGQGLGANRPLKGNTLKKWTKQVPSSQELAEQYFDLQCLRQWVELAETSEPTRRRVADRPDSPRALS
jgi:hypothetical protein